MSDRAPPRKKRNADPVSLLLTPAVIAIIDDLQARTGAASRAEVVRRALAAYRGAIDLRTNADLERIKKAVAELRAARPHDTRRPYVEQTYHTFTWDEKRYMTTGIYQLYTEERLVSEDDVFKDPVVLRPEVRDWLKTNSVFHGENALTGVPTFIFPTEAAWEAFKTTFIPDWVENKN